MSAREKRRFSRARFATTTLHRDITLASRRRECVTHLDRHGVAQTVRRLNLNADTKVIRVCSRESACFWRLIRRFFGFIADACAIGVVCRCDLRHYIDIFALSTPSRYLIRLSSKQMFFFGSAEWRLFTTYFSIVFPASGAFAAKTSAIRAVIK